MRRIGFTGTREGLTLPQHGALIAWIANRERGELHHGDCRGADEAAHATAQHHGWRLVGHPGDNRLWRAFLTGFSALHEPKPNLARNSNIVAETDELLATPDGPERLRSGTWSTVRKARAAKKLITIIWPDGTVTREPADAAAQPRTAPDAELCPREGQRNDLPTTEGERR